MKVIGIDPGKKGGIARYSGDTDSLVLVDIPLIDGEINWPELMDMIDLMVLPADHVFIEKVGAMPHQGVSSMFKFGYVTGEITGVFRPFRIPITRPSPSVWKPVMKVKADKTTSVVRAMELFPKRTAEFKGPRGGYKDGLAEAALLAVYGYTVLVNGMYAAEPAVKPHRQARKNRKKAS